MRMKDSVSVRASNRQARDARESQFEALAAFANMGDSPQEWKKFRLQWPNFFPTDRSGPKRQGFSNVTEWLYSSAEEFATPEFANLSKDRRLTPPLLWYRNHLRAVWTRNDPHGYHLAVLLGFEQEAKNIVQNHPDAYAHLSNVILVRPYIVPGQPVSRSEPQSEALPQGKPLINGRTGEIRWKFGCDLQQAVYELMQCRWRAKVCAVCGRYFIAAKTATQYCSSKCTTTAKNARSLDYWKREGRAKRDARSHSKSAQRRK